MNKFLRLFKFKLYNRIGLGGIKSAFASPGLRIKATAIFLSVLIILCIFVFLLIFTMSMMYKSFVQSGDKDLYLNFIFIFAQLIGFFTLIISSFNSMFNSKEHNILSSLPVKREHIFMTSYVELYVSFLVSMLMIVLPGLGVYQYYEGFSLTFTLRALPGYILFPALPATVVTFVMFAVMIVAGRFKHTELISTLSGVALIVACFILYLSLSTGGSSYTQDDLAQSLIGNSDLIEILSKCMINVFAFKMLLGSVYEFLIGAIILIVIFATTCFITYFAGGCLYEKVMRLLSSSAGGRWTKTDRYRKSSVQRALIRKEFKLLLRSPAYVMNCIINVILGPLMMLIFGIQSYNKEAAVGEDIFSRITVLLKNNMNADYVICGLITALTIAVTAFGMVASTCVSREGSNFTVMQTIPVSYKDQIKAKLTSALIINLVCVITTMGVGGVLFGINFLPVLLGIIICIIASLPFNYIGAFIDVMRPKIYWDKESQAVKQNANGMISLLLCIVLTILYALPFTLYVVGVIDSIVFVVVLTMIMEVIFLILTRMMLFRLINNKEIYR